MTKDYNKTYVAFLDILGFKDLALNNNHEELLNIYKIFNDVTLDSLVLFKYVRNYDQLIKDLSGVKINSLVISDSVILWTDDLSYYHFFNLLLSVRFLLSQGIFTGIPLRGSIVVGPLTIKNEKIPTSINNSEITFLGKSIVDAHSLCEKQNWSGCVLSDTCIETYRGELNRVFSLVDDPIRLENAISVENLERRLFLKKCIVPYKEEKSKEEYTVNWPNVIDPKLSEKTIRNSFSEHNKRIDSIKVERIIENTISFWTNCPEREKEISM